MTGHSQAHIDRDAYRHKWGVRGDDETYSPERDGPRTHKRDWVIRTISAHLTEVQGEAAVAWVKICHPKRSLGAERVDTCGNGTEAARVYALDHDRQRTAVEQAVFRATDRDCVVALRAIGDLVTHSEFERRVMMRMERGGIALAARTLDAVSAYFDATADDVRTRNANSPLDGSGPITAKKV